MICISHSNLYFLDVGISAKKMNNHSNNERCAWSMSMRHDCDTFFFFFRFCMQKKRVEKWKKEIFAGFFFCLRLWHSFGIYRFWYLIRISLYIIFVKLKSKKLSFANWQTCSYVSLPCGCYVMKPRRKLNWGDFTKRNPMTWISPFAYKNFILILTSQSNYEYVWVPLRAHSPFIGVQLIRLRAAILRWFICEGKWIHSNYRTQKKQRIDHRAQSL